MASDVIQLLKDVQAAFDDVNAKGKIRDDAAAALQAATEEHKHAAETLTGLQRDLNAILGKVLPGGDARIRIA